MAAEHGAMQITPHISLACGRILITGTSTRNRVTRDFGAIAGVFAGMLIKLEIIMPRIINAGCSQWGMCAAALLAGYTERFVPSILSDINTNNNEGISNDP